MILEMLFEPTVIFFGLTNSPATFQAIMNKILKNLINTGEVASFIDNAIVGIEEEERHDKVVKEVVKRLEKNNLYVKLEKCKFFYFLFLQLLSIFHYLTSIHNWINERSNK